MKVSKGSPVPGIRQRPSECGYAIKARWEVKRETQGAGVAGTLGILRLLVPTSRSLIRVSMRFCHKASETYRWGPGGLVTSERSRSFVYNQVFMPYKSVSRGRR